MNPSRAGSFGKVAARKNTGKAVGSLPYTHTVERVATNKLSGKANRKALACRLTAKRIMLENGEVYDRAHGRRVMALANRVWGDYTWTLDMTTLRPQEAK